MSNGDDKIVTVCTNIYTHYGVNKLRFHVADCFSNNIANFTWNLSDKNGELIQLESVLSEFPNVITVTFHTVTLNEKRCLQHRNGVEKFIQTI